MLTDAMAKAEHVRPCERCADLAPRKFFVNGLWICAGCVSPQPCESCGVSANARIERYAVGNADDDTYRLAQTLLFVCESKHVSVGPTQDGPSAIMCVVFRTQLTGARKTSADRGPDTSKKITIAQAVRNVLALHPSGLFLRDIVPKVQELRAPVETSSAVVSASLQSLLHAREVERNGSHRQGVYKLASEEGVL